MDYRKYITGNADTEVLLTAYLDIDSIIEYVRTSKSINNCINEKKLIKQLKSNIKNATKIYFKN